MSSDETIIAVASAPGLSSQAVVRLSGPQAVPAVARLCGGEASALLKRRGFTGMHVVLNLGATRLPVWTNVYRAPKTYTREDVVELFVCGSPPILHLLSTALMAARRDAHPLVRWAKPGEFTLRAFLSGRIDLSQAESVASLIGAMGEAEARAARRGLAGEFRDRLDDLADLVTEVGALLEAALDFPDEDLPQVAPDAIRSRLDRALSRLDELRRACGRRSGANGTLRVVLAGFPNAGKSTLLNAILRRQAAIATPVPGTTRDPVRGITVQGGRRVEWVDLAGTYTVERAGAETVSEAAGISREVEGEDDVIWQIVRRLSKLELEAADVVLWILDPTGDVEASLSQCRRLTDKRVLVVVQKVDLLSAGERRWRERELAAGVENRAHFVSALRGQGVSRLVGAVLAASRRSEERSGVDTPRFLVSAHQEAALDAAREALERARRALDASLGYEFLAVDLREAMRALEDLTGKVTTDAILDHVFSRFCIGK